VSRSLRPGELFTTEWLVLHYGAYLDTAKLAHLLSFPNRRALRRAHDAGRLSLPLRTLKGRRGLYAAAEDVGKFLRNREALELHQEGTDMR
jgi:hypothetical protein